MRPSYKFYVFESAIDYVSEEMAVEILFRKMNADISENQFYILRRFIEGREIFWFVCHLDGQESVCVGSKAEMFEFAEELTGDHESKRTGEQIKEAMLRQARANPDVGFRLTLA